MRQLFQDIKRLCFANKTITALFIAYIAIGVFLRTWNIENFLYFIYDQGRDAFVFEQMSQGDWKLTGPTSGVAGFYLGPLWYYVGYPGYLLSQGNVIGFSLWYIMIACLALPLYWFISRKLFTNNLYAGICAVLLGFVPSSIWGSTFIWNPLLSLPLMSFALICFWYARNSRVALGLGFLSVALTLQSEFAYAVFFLPTLYILIPWFRKKFHVFDFLIAAVAVGITLLPQLLFELKNNWVMTKSIFSSVTESPSLPWVEHLPRRIGDLSFATRELLFNRGPEGRFLIFGVIALLGWSVFAIWQQNKKYISTIVEDNVQQYFWKVVSIFMIIPYPLYLIWRGNNGNFFSYYLTSHFIFLVPMLVLGFNLLSNMSFWKRLKLEKTAVAIFCFGIMFGISLQFYSNVFAFPQNKSSLSSMTEAVDKLYEWREEDGEHPGTFLVFTPNFSTQQYDYLIHQGARDRSIDIPYTVKSPEDDIWYLLIEPDRSQPEGIFKPWYQKSTAGGVLVRREYVGSFTLETRMTRAAMEKNRMYEYTTTTRELMCW